jgi:septal ring factor EnvC (AmiA/AmiB activator)
MDVDKGQNGWNEYSKLVLKELESLSVSIANLKGEMQDVKQELIEARVKTEQSGQQLDDRVDELKSWKDKVDDICSPSQLKELVVKVDNLNTFKVKAIGVFLAVQFMMGALAWYLKVA